MDTGIFPQRFFSYLEGKTDEIKKIIGEARNGKVCQPDHCEKEVLIRFFFTRQDALRISRI